MKKKVLIQWFFTASLLIVSNLEAQTSSTESFVELYKEDKSFKKGKFYVDITATYGQYQKKSEITKENPLGIIGSLESLNEHRDDIWFKYLNVEYGVSKKIGISVDFGHGNHSIHNMDRGQISKIYNYDLGFKCNYYLFNSPRNQLSIGIGFGYTRISMEMEGKPNVAMNSAKGSGNYVGFEVRNRFFFSEHLGVLFSLNYRRYTYSNSANFPDGIIVFFPETVFEWDWTFNGVNIGTGLAIKF
jgi:Outer membrane protein beta-barrel domain